jgi:hypothetical protein
MLSLSRPLRTNVAVSLSIE